MKRGDKHTPEALARISAACKASYVRGRGHSGGKQEKLGPDVFCPRGHPKIPENLRSQLCADGRRNWRCRICHREQQLARYYKDREKYLAKCAIYQANNRERHNETARRWSKTPQGQRSKRLLSHRRSGLARDRQSIEYTAILLEDPCSYCGAPTTHIDHIVPVADHGTSVWSNLTSACRRCNQRKNDRSLLAYLAISAGLIRSLKGNYRLRRTQ